MRLNMWFYGDDTMHEVSYKAYMVIRGLSTREQLIADLEHRCYDVEDELFDYELKGVAKKED